MRLAALASRHSTSLLVLGILAGVALPDAASTLRPALSACIAGLLVVSMVRIPWPALRRELARPALPLALTGWLLVGCPLLTWLVLIIVSVPISFYLGMVAVYSGYGLLMFLFGKWTWKQAVDFGLGAKYPEYWYKQDA